MDSLEVAVWEGSLPLCFLLDPRDLASSIEPPPVYINASRMSYLPLVALDIVDHYRAFAVELVSDVWFEVLDHRNNLVPLKCNVPIGVLYDLYRHASIGEVAIVPWRITVHFQGFPSDKLLRCSSYVEIEKQFMHTVKQAMFLLHGNSRVFTTLPLDKQSQLWDAICNTKGPEYYDVTQLLKPTITNTKIVPLRILQCNKPMIQRPFHCWNEDKQTTLGDVSSAITSELGIKKEEYEVVIQGITFADLDMHQIELYSLWSALSSSDLFLYICLHEKET